MKRFTLLFSILFIVLTFNAQKFAAGLSLGASNSFTDIGGQKSGALIDMNIEGTRFAATGIFDVQFKPFYTLSTNISWTSLHGSDEYAKIEGKRIRNIKFNTPLFEFAIINNFNMFEVFEYQTQSFIYPVAGLGFSMIRFNPKSADANAVELKALGTAGQQLPNREFSQYSGWTSSIIYHLGAETKEITSGSLKTFSFGFSLTYHQAFTDYLDDTGHDLYADVEKIREISGDNAAYYSQPGEHHAWHRGGKKNDVFSFVQLTIKKRLDNVSGKSSF